MTTLRGLGAMLLATLLMIPAAAAQDTAPAEQISAFRLKNGEGRVTRDATLDRIAMEQARAMAEKDDLSHEVLGPFNRRVAPSKAGRAAENIAYGYDNFDKTLGQWINSAGHRKNLLLPKATKVGIASAKTTSGKRTYWAMVIAGDYDSDRPKGSPKSKGKPAVAQARPDAKSDARSDSKPQTRWGAKPPASKDCHLNIKLIGLCI
ncbi:secretion protein [Bradyrhizobium sp. SSBR45G]|uniref:CAP domain-containing protein n=1 Tax=unclassified Bradyrhizobium TaxID=2631580 RepID=UPI0023429AFB|nr:MULTISPECIES: CAP domain-containing protein [unclassified Bradyrhizobium]GLH82337.1 secretion protein [Bradyrhizobium sp. SSBR45G]GLH89762.1 secretion protein [Bradyrhizobium sp. SSBR45R]